jgi:hypothetical protein
VVKQSRLRNEDPLTIENITGVIGCLPMPNARLIAAAPDLLAALNLALPILEAANAKCTGDTAFIQTLRAAIAKATGGAS